MPAKCDTLQPQTKGAAIFALSLEDLSRKAELIIEGEVLGKGTHAGNTINVLTRPSEFTFDGVVLTRGENVILFLKKEKMYGNYMVVFYQGKFNIDPKGVVYGFEIKNMSLPEMEKNIADILSKPVTQVNDTSNSNATQVAMYANDSDVVLNDSDVNASEN